MTETDELERRLAATLRAKAAQLTVGDEPFVPGRLSSLTGGAPDGSAGTGVATRRGRSARAVWLAVAAAAAAIGLVAGVALVRADRDPTVTQGATEERAGLVLPSEVPDGYQLWSVGPRAGTDSESAASGPISIQLFGDAQGTRLMIQAGGAERALGVPAGGRSVTVRGQADGTYVQRRDAEDPAKTPEALVHWTEQGVSLTAVMERGPAVIERGTVAEAVAFLDALVWSGDGPLSGADPASAAPFTLLGGTQQASVPAMAQNRYLYDDQPPVVGGTSGLTASFSQSAPNLTAYYENWFRGLAPGPDGVIVQSGTVPVSLADPPSSFVALWWPDGRSATVTSTAVDLAGMTAVARSGQPTTEADLDALRLQITTRILTLPVVATAELSPLSLEVRGDGGSALCARAGSGPVTCAAAGAGSDQAPGLAVSVDVDGDWYVAGAGLRPFAYTAVSHSYLDESNNPVVTTDADVIHWHTTDDGEWHLLVAAMPASVSDSAVSFDTTGTPSCPAANGGSCAEGVFVSRPPR